MNRFLFNTGFRKYSKPAYLLALGLMSFAAPSIAATVALDFVCISHNSAASCAAGAQQLRVNLEQSTIDTATLTFTDVGHREDPKRPLHSIAALSPGSHGRLNFAVGARPSNLPGGRASAVGFETHFSLGAGKPGPKDRERLSVSFLSGYDFASLRSALASGELRLGIHAQGFDGGFSESFASASPTAVPVPETVWLFASGLFGFVGIARRRREQPAPASVDNNGHVKSLGEALNREAEGGGGKQSCNAESTLEIATALRASQ